MTPSFSTTTAHAAIIAVILSAPGHLAASAASAAAPPIRVSPANRVPACVTPAALNRFLADQSERRGQRLAAQFQNIAHHYQRHGQDFGVRWDYAVFQMALETNFLTFRRGNGQPGDVHPNQNNFAGLGTTGGGVPGDSYPDVSTGVLAQIQHLVVYSGQRLSNPVGHRTRLKQDVILNSVGPIARSRPVTFADLARRWAADRHYGRSIQRLAAVFFDGYCNRSTPAAATADQITGAGRTPPAKTRTTQLLPPPPQRLATATIPGSSKPVASKPIAPRPLRSSGPQLQLAAPIAQPQIKSCQVQIASFGGQHTLLIESLTGDTLNLTALNVHPGFEVAMATNFIQSYAPNGRTIGAYPSRSAALSKAHEICRRLGPDRTQN